MLVVREVHGEILVFDGGGWCKSEELYQTIKAATFDDLILPARMKEEIQDDFANFFAWSSCMSDTKFRGSAAFY